MNWQVLWSLGVSWLPFVMLVFVWILLSRQQSARGGWPLPRIADQQAAQVAELQRTNALLDRIAVALERRVEK